MPKRIGIANVSYLRDAALPQQTDTYTVISHSLIIDKVKEMLIAKGFEITDEIYRCTDSANIAQGVYHLRYSKDSELGMMFAWSNSYDKSMKFKCAIGARVLLSENEMISGNTKSFIRKHTGSADEFVIGTITDQITNAEIYYDLLVQDKELMKITFISEEDRAKFLGILYFQKEILTGEQMSVVKSELKKPTHNHNAKGTLWELYNAIIHSLKKAHPKTWMDQQKLAHFSVMSYISDNADKVPVEKQLEINKPNIRQLSLIDAINQAESENVLQQEASHLLYSVDNNPETELMIKNEPEILTIEEDTWSCLKCGALQESTAIFYDGQLCEMCHTEINAL